jgi:hypothetical protein
MRGRSENDWEFENYTGAAAAGNGPLLDVKSSKGSSLRLNRAPIRFHDYNSASPWVYVGCGFTWQSL